MLLQLWRLSAEQHVLLIVQHHSITDGMSLPVLGRDLAAAYTAAVHEAGPQWPPLPASYIDYAAWQRQTFSGPVLQVEHCSLSTEGLMSNEELCAFARR